MNYQVLAVNVLHESETMMKAIVDWLIAGTAPMLMMKIGKTQANILVAIVDVRIIFTNLSASDIPYTDCAKVAALQDRQSACSARICPRYAGLIGLTHHERDKRALTL